MRINLTKITVFNFYKKLLWHCLLICLLLFSHSALIQAKTVYTEQQSEEGSSIFLSLWEQARELQLSQHPYWLKLLHFYSYGESVGQWSFESDVESDSFFLSPNGKTDPEAELKATLIAILKTPGKDPNQDVRCKFIARFNWLRSKLDFPELAKQNCPLFERWANLKDSTGISIIFVSAYLENPASTFGHLLVKFNSRNNIFGHSLLRPTLNFGAIVNPDDNPLEYVLRGLFGGYSGSFTDERFYNFNHVYGENELRDLWEYPLNFTVEQQHRVTYHAWELLQNVKFTYYFFLDNCAYRMAELLEMAWVDKTRINTARAIWAIPVDVLFKLQKFRSETKDQNLLEFPQLIPSRQRKMKHSVAKLNAMEQDQLKLLIDFENHLNSAEFRNFSEHSQARIIDALLDYLQYVKKGKIDLLQQKGRNNLLLARSQLPILGNVTSVEPPNPPTEGTPPMRFRFGTVFNKMLGPAFEIGTWANYHDLLGSETGHLANTEVVTLELRLQVRNNMAEVSKFQLFNIQKYALNPSGISGDFEWSWRAHAGWERENLGCFPCRVFRFSGGFGRSMSIAVKDLEYAFIDIVGETSTSLSATTLGYAPNIGMTWNPLDNWKIKLEGGLFKSFYGPKNEYLRSSFDQRISISQNWDIRFEIERHERVEGTLALHYFW